MRALLRLAARNARRRRARTLLTAGMVVAGVALLMIALTWITGIFGGVLEEGTAMGGHVRLVNPEYAAREELFPLDANLPDVAAAAKLVETEPGVVAVEPRILTGVTVTVGREIGDVFGVATGASERYFRERLKAADKIRDGRWFSGKPGELIVGAKVAEEAGAKPGDEVVLLGMTQDGSMSPIKGTLVGIVRSGGLLDRQILVPLDRMQWLADLTGGATELLIFGDSFAAAGALARRLRAKPALRPYLVQSWAEREPLASIGRVIGTVRFFVVAVVVLLAAVGIWNTMTTSVLERTREIGVLRALGMSRTAVVLLVVAEAGTIAVLGGIAGLLAGWGPSWMLEHYGIRFGDTIASQLSLPISEVMRGRLTPGVAVGSFLLGLGMAFLGSVPAALRAASIQPVTAMRSGR